MPVVRYYEITCNVCDVEYSTRLGGLALSDPYEATKQGWLILDDATGEPSDAICPECRQKITAMHQKTNDDSA